MMRLRPAPSATRTPNSRMRLAARASKQVGRVAAGNQQDDAHRAEQQPQQRTDMAHGAVNEVLDQGAPTAHLRGREACRGAP